VRETESQRERERERERLCTVPILSVSRRTHVYETRKYINAFFQKKKKKKYINAKRTPTLCHFPPFFFFPKFNFLMIGHDFVGFIILKNLSQIHIIEKLKEKQGKKKKNTPT
jgi:hypothetical protein